MWLLLLILTLLILPLPVGCVIEALHPKPPRPQVEVKVDGRWVPESKASPDA